MTTTPSTATFARERVRHELAVRHLEVASIAPVVPAMVRVTLRGGDLAGFVATGPADHVKVFFPDPATGILTTPVMTDEGIARPETGTIVSRDYTPLEFRAEGPDGPELDIDFVLHGDDGPASAWAARAQAGDTLTIAGPRGSHLPPVDATEAIVIADETALPAALRWIETLSVPVTGLFTIADEATSAYLETRPARTLRWFAGADRDAELETALRSLSVGPGTFVFLAGEATALVPLRRYLRKELGLPAAQVDPHGYWKRGVENLDHHAPLDPSDPD